MSDWGVVISRSGSGLIVWVDGGFPGAGAYKGPLDAAVGVRFHGPRPRPGRGASSFPTVFVQVAG